MIKRLLTTSLFMAVFAFPATRTDLTDQEKLEIVSINREGFTLFQEADAAKKKMEQFNARAHARIDAMKSAHSAANCELNLATMLWEACKVGQESIRSNKTGK